MLSRSATINSRAAKADGAIMKTYPSVLDICLHQHRCKSISKLMVIEPIKYGSKLIESGEILDVLLDDATQPPHQSRLNVKIRSSGEIIGLPSYVEGEFFDCSPTCNSGQECLSKCRTQRHPLPDCSGGDGAQVSLYISEEEMTGNNKIVKFIKQSDDKLFPTKMTEKDTNKDKSYDFERCDYKEKACDVFTVHDTCWGEELGHYVKMEPNLSSNKIIFDSNPSGGESDLNYNDSSIDHYMRPSSLPADYTRRRNVIKNSDPVYTSMEKPSQFCDNSFNTDENQGVTIGELGSLKIRHTYDGCGKSRQEFRKTRSNELKIPLKEYGVREVVYLFCSLSLARYKNRVTKLNIDGKALCALNEAKLSELIGMTRFEAKLLIFFIQGWRPKTDFSINWKEKDDRSQFSTVDLLAFLSFLKYSSLAKYMHNYNVDGWLFIELMKGDILLEIVFSDGTTLQKYELDDLLKIFTPMRGRTRRIYKKSCLKN